MDKSKYLFVSLSSLLVGVCPQLDRGIKLIIET